MQLVSRLIIATGLALGGSSVSAQQPAPAAPTGNAEKGKTLFVERACWQCHGREGQGGGAAGPRLAGRVSSWPAFSRYVRRPTEEMVPYTVKVLPDAELADIYAWLRSIPAPPPVASIPQLAQNQASASTASRSCAELARIALPNATITTETVAAGAFKAPAPAFPGLAADFTKLPEFCRVTGSIKPSADSDIRFEVWLPTNWNGKFLQTGNGGAAGSIVHTSLAVPLARGYAVANTDTGHQGAGGDFAWAVGHPEKLTDYAYRAVHELTVVGKAVTTARYGKAPARSYWDGCSTGGRQGLKEAQRFPDDYDAIVAGAPANNWSALMASSILTQRNLTGAGALGIDKLGLLKDAAIAACDARDGVADRVIDRPAACSFDPAALQCSAGQAGKCLSASEVAAARRIYSGVVSKAGTVMLPGTGPGSEPLWGAYASPGFSIGTNYFRNVVATDQNWDPAAFDVDADLARMEAQDAGTAKATDPDLGPYLARGGKLLIYHGTTDGLIPYGNSVNYYSSVVNRLGADRTRDSVALYLVPGMDHCAGGEGAFAVDWLGALERWDATGKPPATIPGLHPPGPPGATAGTKPFTRPICAYPQVPRYKGAGDNADAANWVCVAE
jgi:feruloyl esterase